MNAVIRQKHCCWTNNVTVEEGCFPTTSRVASRGTCIGLAPVLV